MEVVNIILNSLGVALAAVQAAPNVSHWLADWLRQEGRARKPEEIRKLLAELGLVTDKAIDHAVENWGTGKERLTGEQRADLADLLKRLARGANFVSTHATPRSCYLRSEKLLDQLLTNLRPVCKRGELVSPGQDWRLVRFLGIGGFGEVWLAVNPHTGEQLAYKFFTRPDAREWVRREQANLTYIRKQLGQHPNIVRFVDVAIDQPERPYLALEYVDGCSLEDWILEDHANRPAFERGTIIKGIVAGLAEAHERGIAHRDLKPANILLPAIVEGASAVPKIADFGLGQVVQENRPALSAQVSQGVLVGTTMYLPPEAQNLSVVRCPKQDDVFALGVVWYQLMVGCLERPPYDFADCLRRVSVDSHTIRLIERCLAHPNRRFCDAGEVLEALDASAPLDQPELPERLDVRPILREFVGTLQR